MVTVTFYVEDPTLTNTRISRLFENDERQSDLLRRSFWSILLIERFVALDFSLARA